MRSDGERDRWEIAAPAAAKSAAARRPGGPARPLQKGACPHNDLAPRVRGQSKQWLTDWHRKLVVLQVNSNALWAIWPRFLIRDSAQNGARRLTDGPYGMRKPHPPCPSHRQALSRLDNARRTGCSRPEAVARCRRRFFLLARHAETTVTRGDITQKHPAPRFTFTTDHRGRWDRMIKERLRWLTLLSPTLVKFGRGGHHVCWRRHLPSVLVAPMPRPQSALVYWLQVLMTM